MFYVILASSFFDLDKSFQIMLLAVTHRIERLDANFDGTGIQPGLLLVAPQNEVETALEIIWLRHSPRIVTVYRTASISQPEWERVKERGV